jgi:formylglycine-generating enzyme required for sulfatase activity
VGTSTYPWGDYYPPHWDDGNYAFLADGKDDPKRVGVDGILGTAPVGSFKPNVLGFYDLGGNATEWMLDGFDVKDPKSDRVYRGGYFNRSADSARSADRRFASPSVSTLNGGGFRLARGRLQSGEAGSR